MRCKISIAMALCLVALPVLAADDEDKLFGSDTMVVTNTKKLEKDPNTGTGRLFQLGGSLAINSTLGFGTRGGLPEQPFSFSSDLIAFMDSRLNSHLRGYASLLYSYSHADRTNSIFLNEAFIDFDIRDRLFFRIGKQRFKSGLGMRWRATDWINSDPVDTLDSQYADSLRTGVTGIRLWTKSSTLFLRLPEGDDVTRTRLLLKQDITLGGIEFSLSCSVEKGTAAVFGLGASFGALGIDWYVESALSGEAARPRVALVEPGERTMNPLENIRVYREEGVRPLVVAGGSYNNQARRLGFSFEYFFNSAGYSDADLYPYAALAGAAVPNYLGRHYLALAGSKSEIFSLTDSCSLTALGNLSDMSFALYPVYTLRINDNLALSLSLTWFFGSKNGEYTFPRLAADGTKPFTITDPLAMTVAYGEERDWLKVNVRLELGL